MTGTGGRYLYALLQTADAPAVTGALDDLSALAVGPLSLVELGPFTLLAAPHDGTDLLPTRRSLRAHARVLEMAMDRATVLPMRFGIVTEDDAALAATLTRQRASLAARFAALEGCVEYGLRIAFDADAALAALLAEDPSIERSKGAAAAGGYQAAVALGRRVAEALAARRAAAEHDLAALLRPRCADVALRPPEEDTEVLRADVLVPREAASALLSDLEGMARETGFASGAEPQIRAIGPSPAYAFARIVLPAAGA